MSGGWDSRFLATLAARDGREVVTVTASDEFGRDEEPIWAAEVADRLGLPNERVDPPENWWRAAQYAARQQEFLTSKNHWLVPLLDPLTVAGGTLLDGLAGDVFVKMNVPGELAVADPAGLIAGMRQRFAPPVVPGEMLARSLAEEVDARVAERIEACWAGVEHHPAALHLLNYHLRTATGVGLSPTLLFAAAAPIVVPFLATEVLAHTIAVRATDKRDKRWYRLVMAQLGHDLAAIPSTNDTRPRRRVTRRADLRPSVAAQTWRELTDDVVDAAVGPRLRAALRSGNVLDPRHVLGRRVVRGLVLYAWWVRAYQDDLVETRLVSEGPGLRVWSGWSEPAPTPLPRTVPDRGWLDAQRVDPTLLVHLEGDPAPASAVTVSTDPLGADTAPSTALIAGTPASFGEFVAALDEVTATVVPGGRVVLSLGLPSTDTPGIGIMGVCETVAAELDLIHVQATARRLRVIAAVADRTEAVRPVPLELLAAAMHGLEARIHVLDRDLDAATGRIRELERDRVTSAEEARAQLQRHRLRVCELQQQVDRMRQRRVWRLVDALGAARKSPVRLLRLPWDLARILVRRSSR